MVEHLSDDDLRTLPRGGHDYRKLYAAYKMAVEHEGSPTVILAKTIKGWTLGAGIESRNATHQIKKLTARRAQGVPRPSAAADPRLRARRRRPAVLAPGHRLTRVRVHDGAAPRARRLGPRARRAARRRSRAGAEHTPENAGRTPTCSRAPARRCRRAPPPRSRGCCATCCAIPTSARASCRSSPTKRARSVSTRCSASTRSTRRSVSATSRSTPSCCCRTARRATGASSRRGSPRPGSMASLTAAGTSYATWNQPMIPFFIFYSMFGFQRVGDLIWSFGDQRGRGFLLGATAGRTTLAGEGLQHCDGQSQLLASAYPNCRGVRPRVRVRDGRDHPRRHRADVRPRARGLLLLHHPLQRELPDAGDARGRRGRHRARAVPVPRRAGGRERCTPTAQILASGTAMLAALDAQQMLADEYGRRRRRVERDELQAAAGGRARRTERWNRLHPTEPARTPYVTEHAATTARARSSR